MKDIWTEGLEVVSDKTGEAVEITPIMLQEIFRQMKIQDGKNIVAVYTSNTYSDEQYIAVKEALDDIQSCDSGDDEYNACIEVLGENFDERESLTFRMNASIRFNRPINPEKDYISPGGYEMVMDGQTIMFDFEEYEGGVDEDDKCLLHISQKNPDYDCYEDLQKVTKELLSNVTEIEEFTVCVSDDLEVVAVEHLSFVLPYDNWKEIIVSKEVLDAAKINNTRE